MLQKAFFKVDVVDRIYDTPVFAKTTPGAYEFTVPEEYNYVVIEYAGAGGGAATVGVGYIGNGAVLKTDKLKIKNNIIKCIIGERGKVLYGGSGYESGKNGDSENNKSGGGGGGSTAVTINNILYQASGGGGQVCKIGSSPFGDVTIAGGWGGGPYPGSGVSSKDQSKKNAQDVGAISYNSGNGYVKIWAGYDPCLKG